MDIAFHTGYLMAFELIESSIKANMSNVCCKGS